MCAMHLRQPMQPKQAALTWLTALARLLAQGSAAPAGPPMRGMPSMSGCVGNCRHRILGSGCSFQGCRCRALHLAAWAAADT